MHKLTLTPLTNQHTCHFLMQFVSRFSSRLLCLCVITQGDTNDCCYMPLSRSQELLWICPKFINTGVQRQLKARRAPRPSTKASDPPQDGRVGQQRLPKAGLSVTTFNHFTPASDANEERHVSTFLTFLIHLNCVMLWVYLQAVSVSLQNTTSQRGR